MLIQLQSQHLAILELELELLAIEPRFFLVDDAVVIEADDNDGRGVVVLRTCEVVNVVSLDNAVAILIANLLAADLVAIVVEPLQGQDSLSAKCHGFSSIICFFTSSDTQTIWRFSQSQQNLSHFIQIKTLSTNKVVPKMSV